MMEGIAQPFFGFAWSIDKVQFNFNISLLDKIDHSRSAIRHAQKIANFLVDEARLSPNFFTYRDDESKRLIHNFDTYLIERKVEHSDILEKHEFYLFK